MCTFLVGLEPADLTGPLTQFQATKNTRADVFKLMGSINGNLESPRTDKQLEDALDVWWPKLEESLENTPKPATSSRNASAHRPEADKTDEILTRVRAIERSISGNRIDEVLDEMLERLEAIGVELMAGGLAPLRSRVEPVKPLPGLIATSTTRSASLTQQQREVAAKQKVKRLWETIIARFEKEPELRRQVLEDPETVAYLRSLGIDLRVDSNDA